MKQKPLVSIIITTKNESDVIETLLKSISLQTYKKIETVVVDNNSTDSTVSIAKKYTSTVYNFGPERSAQRNYGVKNSSGKYVLILDADMELTPKVVEECVELAFSDSSIGAIFIPEKSIGQRFWEKVKSFERSFYEKSLDYWIESARFFSKKAFKQAGGYDESITGPEDWDLSENVRKIGYKTARTKAKIYHHERIQSITKIVKKWYYYGLRSHRTIKKQKIGLVNPKTISFLRPVFYKQWQRLIAHPILTSCMFFLLVVQTLAGGTGFLIGKIKNI